jgi:hypothetical protein
MALDAKYGRNPDLKAMLLYCVAMANKGIYDAKDMRTTGGADVNYAMDVPPEDSTLVARLRASGAILYAQAHESEFNAGSGDPGGSAKVERPYIGQGGWRLAQYDKGGVILQDLAVPGLPSGPYHTAEFVIDHDACYADFDGSGVLDLFDFLAFVNAFNAPDEGADCAEDGVLDFFDFLCFTNAFNAGC